MTRILCGAPGTKMIDGGSRRDVQDECKQAPMVHRRVSDCVDCLRAVPPRAELLELNRAAAVLVHFRHHFVKAPVKRGITRDYTPSLLILQGMALRLQGITLPPF